MGSLATDMTRLRGEIDGLHEIREAFLNDLKHDVAEMQSNFRNERADMAKRLIDDLVKFVSDLKADVAEMKGDFRNERADMAKRLIDDLRMFVSGLNKTVAGLRQEFATDIKEAHQAWFGASPAEHKAEVERKVKEEKQRIKADAELKETKEESKGAKEVIPDDLTEINGIGPGRQKLLNGAGFYTFAQLANTTPEQLRPFIGESIRLEDMDMWIEQAKGLA